jgi:hypothetical protein
MYVEIKIERNWHGQDDKSTWLELKGSRNAERRWVAGGWHVGGRIK